MIIPHLQVKASRIHLYKQIDCQTAHRRCLGTFIFSLAEQAHGAYLQQRTLGRECNNPNISLSPFLKTFMSLFATQPNDESQ